MHRAIEVTLAKPIVKPLIAVIRGLCAESASSDAERAAPSPSLQADRRELLLLFGWYFITTGRIQFDELNARPVLRSCAELRLRLRASRLSSLPDQHMEASDLDVASLAEPLRTDYMTYLFLATLQEQILQHFDPLFETTLDRHPLAETGASLGRSWRRLRQKLRGVPAPPPAAPAAIEDEPDARVVVLNDPVNLMSYVKAVFVGVLGYTSGTAKRLMLEVHEQGRTLAWSGPQSEAEARAAQLRAWHLSVTVE